MAATLVADQEVSQGEATELLGSLVSKSLVQFKIEGSYNSYRLLDITRCYAFDKLGEMGEVRAMADRHDRIILHLLEGSGSSQDGDGGRHTSELIDDLGKKPLCNSAV